MKMTNENNVENFLSTLKITKDSTVEDVISLILNNIKGDNDLIDRMLSGITPPLEGAETNNAALFLASTDGVSKLLKVKNDNYSNLMKLIETFLKNNKQVGGGASEDGFSEVMDEYIDEKVREKILNG